MSTNRAFPILDNDDIPELVEEDVSTKAKSVYDLLNSEVKKALVDIYFQAKEKLRLKVNDENLDITTEVAPHSLEEFKQFGTITLWLGIDKAQSGIGAWFVGEGNRAEDALCFTQIPLDFLELKKAIYFIKCYGETDRISLATILDREEFIVRMLLSPSGVEVKFNYCRDMLGAVPVINLTRRKAWE